MPWPWRHSLCRDSLQGPISYFSVDPRQHHNNTAPPPPPPAFISSPSPHLQSRSPSTCSITLARPSKEFLVFKNCCRAKWVPPRKKCMLPPSFTALPASERSPPLFSLPIVLGLTDSSNVDVLVIGAGPTGLGAAKRLHQTVTRLAAHSRATSRTPASRTAHRG